MKNLKPYLWMAFIGLAGIAIGAQLFGSESGSQSLDEHIAEVHTNEAGEIVYTCSMHPQIRQNEPGDCPICGMDLIPADNTSSGFDPNSVGMSEAAMRLAEIETAPVFSGIPTEELRIPGKVGINKNISSAVTSHVNGRIIDLYVDFEGSFVEKGQKMASIYSPELIAAQQELLETAKVKTRNPALYEASRRKLELWELPISTIDKIVETKKIMRSVDIVSPVSGYVQSIYVDRQQHVMAGTMMYQIVNLSSVWVMFDVFEQDLAKLNRGQEVDFTTPSVPGKTFTGKVDYIDPLVNNSKRTTQIRVEVNNAQELLKPNMSVEGLVRSKSTNPAVMIPKSAVLWTGTRSIVFVQDKNSNTPTFTAREVTLGNRVGDSYIVLKGLQSGEHVVVNGTFKIDSAAQLADKLSMMNRTPGTGVTQTGHEGHAVIKTSATVQSSNTTAESSSTTEGESIPLAFKNQLQSVIKEYLGMKDALVNSDQPKANQGADNMLKALSKADMSLLKGQEHLEWMRFLNDMYDQVQTISVSKSIENQRAAFSKLSPKLIEVVKHFKVSGVYYQQFCPMSNDGEGAYWLSNSSEIANPYYGDAMHNCGETITKIEF